jgi:glycosyltransferase involved in cell wall biosynthesis
MTHETSSPEFTPSQMKNSGLTGSAKTHILFVIDSLVRLAGAERNLLNICRLLPNEKYRCSVVVLKHGTRPEDLQQFPCDVHVWPLTKTYDLNAVKVALKLRGFIRAERVDIVHTFFETSDLWAAPIAKLSGCRVVSSRRDMGILRSGKHRLAYRIVNPMFDSVLTVSNAVRDFALQEGGIDPVKTAVIRNGIDINQVASAKPCSRRDLQLADASHLICSVGFIRQVKGFDILIRAAGIVCKEFPKAVFLIVGEVIGAAAEQQYFTSLQHLATSMGLANNIKFLGASNQVPSILKMCDVFALLSRSEGLPNVLLEAMACGVPCVATTVGGSPEVLSEPGTGYLVPPHNPKVAADHILMLLRDPQLALRTGEAGRRMVLARFSAQAMVGDVDKFYRHLMRGEPTLELVTASL